MSGTVRHFCTYFDSNYLLRGLAMYRSLQATGIDCVLHVIALDEECARALTSLREPALRVVRLEDFEAAHPELAAAKADRSRVEYYFTMTPLLPLHVFAAHPDLDLVTYVDADLCFYRSPEVLFDELGAASILLCPHRYPAHLRHKEIYGRYNVQFQTFRRDEAGLACLERWRDQCLEWCYDRVEEHRYADQKYLDEWPARYAGHVVETLNSGVGVAPWNWAGSRFSWRDGDLLVDGEPIVFYHFHGLKLFSPYVASNGLLDWGMMPFRLRRFLYAGYVRRLRSARQWLHERTGIDVPMRDRVVRGKRPGLSSIGEIARKAWSQLLLVP